jgi:hypothetical protein
MYIDCFPDSEFVKTHFDKDNRGLRGQKACNHYDFEWWLSLFYRSYNTMFSFRIYLRYSMSPPSGKDMLFSSCSSITSLFGQVLVHFRWEFLNSVHVCLLPYKDCHIFTTVCQVCVTQSLVFCVVFCRFSFLFL